MAKAWQDLKAELEEEIQRLFTTCPDEIKRFHYGIITHSDAGKYSLNQYFGHWVHLYAFYMSYSDQVLGSLMHFANDPHFDLEQMCILFRQFAPPRAIMEYGGQNTMANYVDEVVATLDTLKTKEEFIQLLKAWMAFVSRLYWWLHWYFPWGVGPGLFPRLSPEDIKEIVRLSQTG